MRIGMGYDVHRLQEGCKLIMGGVEIPYEKGLLGHSDADVLVHAVMDALLGAGALGDIGKHFPDTDPAYKGISSILLLQKVGELLEEHCFLIENIDATIIAQAPKMRPHIDQMRQNMADALKIDVSQINVKATTEEGLGFTGAGEGISAQAICLLNSPMGLYDQNVTSGCGGCGSPRKSSPPRTWPRCWEFCCCVPWAVPCSAIGGLPTPMSSCSIFWGFWASPWLPQAGVTVWRPRCCRC